MTCEVTLCEALANNWQLLAKASLNKSSLPILETSCHQRFGLIGPFEWLGHGCVEVVDESEELIAEFALGVEVSTFNHLFGQDAKPNLDLVHPRGMLRGCLGTHFRNSLKIGRLDKINPLF